jgi:tetratricopeptide (TPR) repeat protein
MSTDQPARNAVATRAILMSASSVCLLASLLTPALAMPAADCQWADDPAAVVQSCTAQLNLEEAPASWMYFNRGLAFKLLGKLNAAQRDYSKAIDLDPTFAAAYANRGNVRIICNNVNGAMADFQRALALDPNDEVTRANFDAIVAALRKVGADKSSNGSRRSLLRKPRDLCL